MNDAVRFQGVNNHEQESAGTGVLPVLSGSQSELRQT